MVSKMTVIQNPAGLHARPATELIALVKKFDCKVYLQVGEKRANAASIINLLTLGAHQGTEIEVICEGSDEQLAVDAIADFIKTIKE